jgi:hypothetical protein
MSYRRASYLLLSTVLGLGTICLLFLQPPKASAIPAFARKYQTSCSTCHNDFPELNDFGEAFKKNGFRFPKDDETYVKEPPVLLGAPAQRLAFPDAIYPGEIPGTIPIGFRYSGFAQYNSKQPVQLGFLPRTDLFAPNTFTIISAGAFGSNISFWVDDDVSAGGSGADGGLGDGYLKVNDLSHYLHLPRNSVNVRFGQFELDLPITQARTINLTPYDIYEEAAATGPGGTTANPFLFGEVQRGIEIGGYPNNGNFEWSVAVVNGNNGDPAIRNSKDVYVHLSQRFNLERDAKQRAEVQAAGPTGPRDHTSIRFDAFGYYGDNALNLDGTAFPGFGTIHEPFYRVGGASRFKYRNFEVYALGMFGHDENLIPEPDTLELLHGTPVTFSGGFAEAEYWFYPWLIGLMRYDLVNSSADYYNGFSEAFARNRYSPGVQILLRANIKIAFEYEHRWRQPVPDTGMFFRPNGFMGGVDYAF